MNKFDKKFFKKYVPEWQEMMHIVHAHPIIILGNLIVKIILFLGLPLYFYYFSNTIHEAIPFKFVEIYLFFIYTLIIYDIFNRYNDVWIITNSAIIWLEWSMFKTKTESINLSNIEWIWVEEDWISDKLLKKWDLIIHKVWDEEFVLENAINPYRAVDLIEWAANPESDDSSNITDERFNQLLEAISGAVWDHVHSGKFETKTSLEAKKDLKKEVIKRAENTDWTIDLRE